jgi:hypothetical protein
VLLRLVGWPVPRLALISGVRISFWRAFRNDLGRVRHPSPEDHRASVVADLRDVASRYPADRQLAAMIGD